MKDKFEVVSGKVRVSDPCYGRDTWCAGELPAKNGTWEAELVFSDEGSWGERVARLIATHVDHNPAKAVAIPVNFEVGVDSGQAGIFCDSLYPATEEEQGEYGELDTFYGKVCELTCGEESGGIVDGKGVVSSSGFGDGGYTATATGEDGQATRIEIVFISDEEDEDEDDFYDDLSDFEEEEDEE